MHIVNAPGVLPAVAHADPAAGPKKLLVLAHSLSGGFGKGLARRPYVRLCVPRPAARVRPVNIVYRGHRVTTRVQIVTAPVCAARGGPEKYPCAHAPAFWRFR